MSDQKRDSLLALVVTLLGIILVGWLSTHLDGLGALLLLLGTAVLVTAVLQYGRIRTYRKLDVLRHQVTAGSLIGQEVVANVALEELLRQIAEYIRSEFAYDYVCIVLADDANRVQTAVQVGVQSRKRLHTEEQVLENIPVLARAFQTSEPMIVRGRQATDLLPGMQAEFAVALVTAQETIGVLDMQSQHRNAFDADVILALQALAAQTAVTIRNAILYQREISRRRLAETLNAIGLALADSLDRKNVLDLILEQLDAIVQYDRAALLLQRENGLEIVAARGFPSESQPLNIRVMLDVEDEDDIYLVIHRTRKPHVVPDLSTQPNWVHVDGLPRANSWLGVPLIHDNDVIGMLSLVRELDNPIPYSLADTEHVVTFGVQSAIALYNKNLFNRIEQYNIQLSYEMQQRTEAVLQLARLDQAKTKFIDIAAHELRTPLTSILGYSQMLLQEKSIQDVPYQLQLANGIYQGADRLHDIVNNLLNVAKIDNATLDLHPQPFSLILLLRRICEGWRESISQRNLTVEFNEPENLPDIEGDLQALSTVFSHLLLNAMKYTPDGGRITVSYELVQNYREDQGAFIAVEISDTGIGIAPEVQDLIFEKFYQTGETALHSSGKTKYKGGGPGLGLSIVRGIVMAHAGKVWVDSPGYDEEKLPGSKFFVLLPVKQPRSAAK
jgi:signal transduction histidine kinase